MRQFIYLGNNRASFAWWFSVAAFTALTHLVAANATAQTWTYQSYATGQGGGTYSNKDRLAPGYVTLEDNGGRAVFKMSAGNLNKCYQGELDAVVTKTEATTIIATVPRLRGCEEIRFVIRNDGTGGQREIKKGENWVWDGLDRGLTLRK